MRRVISVDIPLLWKTLVQVVHNGTGVFGDTSKSPGVFMMVVPAETVEDTLDELLQFCSEGDIIIDHGNSNFKDSRRRADSLLNWACHILTVALVAVFTVWSVDTVLWLVVQILQYPPALQSLGHSHQVSEVLPGQIHSVMRPLLSMVGLHCGPPGAGHFVKMVHNGIEYGIMQAYAEGFNILHEANAGSAYVAAGDAEVAPMDNPEDYCYDIDVSEVAELWRRGSVVGSWLLDLTADVLRGNRELASSMGEYQTVVRGVGLFTLLWILAYPLLSSAARCGHALSRAVWVLSQPKVLNGMRGMFWWS